MFLYLYCVQPLAFKILPHADMARPPITTWTGAPGLVHYGCYFAPLFLILWTAVKALFCVFCQLVENK